MQKALVNSILLFGKVFFFVLIAVFLGAIWIFSSIPSEKEIKSCLTTKMNSVYLCENSTQYVRLKNISPFMISALLISEDASFYQHNGFDFSELEKSLKKNISERRYARGGSTISQQLAKNMFLTKDKTLKRKFLEAIITLRIEKTLSKNQILERYLNIVEFGPKIFGISQAANYYFKVRPEELTLNQSVFLVFLLPNPKAYVKSFMLGRLTEFGEKRMSQILEKLLIYNKISLFEYETAITELDFFLLGEPASNLDYNTLDEESAPTDSDLDLNFEL